MQKRHGFTLIELLIVIAIIGLLATFAMIGLSKTRARARDTKRLTDFAQMQKALALGQNANGGNYPTATPVTLGQPATDVLCLNGANVQFQANTAGCVANNIYIGLVPKDPLSGQAGFDYVYKYTNPASGPWYTICTTLEVGDTNAKLNAGTVVADPNSISNAACP